ncbi:hypothetical protein HQ403_02000 [Candidatus Kaiserbacteria bacterium]|nr:hypothetical protein [Candidatus Kaiserbacteria bacterium]
MEDSDYNIEISTTVWKKIALGVLAFTVPFLFGYVLFFYMTSSKTPASTQGTSVLELKGTVDSLDIINNFLIISHTTGYTDDIYKIRINFNKETIVDEVGFLRNWGVEYNSSYIQMKSITDIPVGSKIYLKYKVENDKFVAIYLRFENILGEHVQN